METSKFIRNEKLDQFLKMFPIYTLWKHEKPKVKLVKLLVVSAPKK